MTQNAHMTQIQTAIAEVRLTILRAEEKYGRTANSVELLAVSKTKPIPMVQEAIKAGQLLFGENYVQEGVDKIAQLQQANCCWHFIGPLQSNKTKLVAENFDWMHTVSRTKIAQRLNEQRPEHLPPLQLCLQVNLDDEHSKSGITNINDLKAVADSIATLPNLKLRGLMSIPTHSNEFNTQRASFAKVREMFETLKSDYPELDTLSMGMSGDLDAAIAEGSTMIRVGTAIFGQRDKK